MSAQPFGVPFPGPLESDPTTQFGDDSVESARQMLTNAITELEEAGVVFGAYDRRILEWLGGWDQPTVAVVASLLVRAVRAGASAKGAEQ